MFCPNCGKEQAGTPTFCYNCGSRLVPEPEAAIPVTALPVKFAGFWRRVGAYLIDSSIVGIATFVAGLIIGNIIYYSLGGPDDLIVDTDTYEAIAIFVPSFVGIIIVWLYYALMESSSRQATLGKMAVGSIVTDSEGRRLSFGRATGRYFAKFISWLILGVGHLMIAFSAKKQGLHDMIADTQVVQK